MLLRVFTEPQQGASYDDLLAVAQKTEECGFDAFFRSDHYMVQGDGDGLPRIASTTPGSTTRSWTRRPFPSPCRRRTRR